MYIEDTKTGVKYFERCEVRLIANTVPDSMSIRRYLEQYGLELKGTDDIYGNKHITQEILTEFIGRHCYMAFGDKAKSKTASEYVKNIINHKHYSVLEHLNYTFLIRGVSRYCTHELVRHRHGSYSQFSTRYCDSDDMAVVLPDTKLGIEEYLAYCKSCFDLYNAAYKKELTNTADKDKPILYRKKAARGRARFYLPPGLEAPIIMTGNLRTFIEAADKRNSEFADSEIRNLFVDILYVLNRMMPEAVEKFIDEKGNVITC